MLWEEYRKVYNRYQVSVNQSRVLTVVAREVLKDFPRRLPSDLRKSFHAGLEGFIHALAAFMAEQGIAVPEKISEIMESRGEHPDQYEVQLDFFIPAFRMVAAAGSLDASPEHAFDFERLLYSQELVVHFAYLDAFMGDSLRAICQVRPEVLKSNRQVDWATILSCGGWSELLAHLCEKYIYEFGFLRFPKRLAFLREQLGLAIRCPDAAATFIEEAENVRDIVVHNAGRVSQEYMRRTGRNDVVIGQFVSLKDEYLDDLADASQVFARALFLSASTKFFNVDASKQPGVGFLHDDTSVS